MEIAETRFITRKEIIKEIGEPAYNRAVETKKLAVYKTSQKANGKQRVLRYEYEQFLESLRQS